MHPYRFQRRSFILQGGMLLTAAACRATRAPVAGYPTAPLASPADRPLFTSGVSFGDVTADRAIVWARSDRPARLLVEWDTSDRFAEARRVLGPSALENTDFTAKLDLIGLPPDQRIFVRAYFQSLRNERATSEPALGSFAAMPAARSHIRFVWTGDTAGQGFGINPDIGGMIGYEAMRAREPDFLLHSGDTIYADGPLAAQQPVEDGKIWRNLVTPEKSKVAETLDEFRGAYRYNLLDANVLRFNAQVPQIWQWDDHEVMNNISGSMDLSHNASYTEKSVPLLVARGKRAFLEYAPMRFNGEEERERIYRKLSYGPLLDVFVLDLRSYRSPNSANLQPQAGPDSEMLGWPQLQWLKDGLVTSRAKWKVIACDMPIGLLVRDGTDAQGRVRFEGVANGNGPALGREHELASLLGFMKKQAIRNTVWLTADVHYTAAHYFDPSKAQFTDFDPFWEFVSGPINAGAFGPADTDDTFGQQVVFNKFPPQQNYSPLSGYQFFGEVNIDGAAESLTVSLRDIGGNVLFEKILAAIS